jgi:predicted HicB family RNase H-like nuclease
MTAISYRGHFAHVEFDPEDEIFTGRLAGVNDVIGFHGASVEALKAAFHEAVDDYVETCAKIGRTPEKPYSGQIMVRVDPAVHAKAALVAQLAGKSLTKWTEETLREAAEREAAAATDV